MPRALYTAGDLRVERMVLEEQPWYFVVDPSGRRVWPPDIIAVEELWEAKIAADRLAADREWQQATS